MASSTSSLRVAPSAGTPDPYYSDVEFLDEESIRLIIALQLEDIQHRHEVNHVDEGGETSAFEMYRRYLEETESFLADRKLAEDIANGIEPEPEPEYVEEQDSELESGPELELEEVPVKLKESVKEDRERDVYGENSLELEQIEGMDLESQIKLACAISLKMFEQEQEKLKEVVPSSSTTVPSATTLNPSSPAATKAQPATKICTGCMEDFEPSALLTPPCAHPYCVNCLRQFFTNAVEVESSFPPQCCKRPIPLYLIYRRLSKSEVKRWRDKVAEYTSRDRIYCSNNACSAFLPLPTGAKSGGHSALIHAEVITCKACKRGTCLRCKAPEHGGDCPEDTDLTATLSTAIQLGWQRCRGCHTLVEKSHGCDHMVCVCNDEWCYRCGAVWKTCPCGEFEEENPAPTRTVEDLIIKREGEEILQRRREEREVQRRAAWAGCHHGGPLSENLKKRAKAREKGQRPSRKGKEREVTLQPESSQSVVQDDSWWGEEGLWKYKLGEARCDLCEVLLKDYIWQCSGCGLEACMACRENGNVGTISTSTNRA